MERALIVAPIERLEERYSDQWYRWLIRDLDAADMPYIVAGGKRRQRIEQGEFLDIYGTNIYKARQAAEVLAALKALHRARIPVTVLYLDGWNPTVEQVAYVRSCAKQDIRIVGIFHAGAYDPFDFLARQGCGHWAEEIERAWLTRIYDRILVATEFHKGLLVENAGADASRIQVVRFPVYTNERLRRQPKENLVIFPHRLAPEKQPEVWDELRSRYQQKYGRAGLRWARTKDLCPNKGEYYALLGRGKVAFSAALQETFGIAMLEAENLGCVPVAPDRLSYPETLEPWPRYKSLPEAVERVREIILDYKTPSVRYLDSMEGIMEGLL